MPFQLVWIARRRNSSALGSCGLANGDGAPAPLARHLMHAARLRYQIRVFDDGKLPHRLRDELGLMVDDLAGDRGGGPDPARLRHAPGAAVALRTRLDAMRHAVEIIGDNMQRALATLSADFRDQADPVVKSHIEGVELTEREKAGESGAPPHGRLRPMAGALAQEHHACAAIALPAPLFGSG